MNLKNLIPGMNIKKMKNIIPWIALCLYMVVMLSFVSAKRRAVPCDNVAVNIANENSNLFVEEIDVVTMLDDKSERILGAPIEHINANKMEELLQMHPSIKEANVHRSFNGVLNIDIQQRIPIMRIIDNNSESYYIDKEGALMPLSSKYAAHVLVVNGNLVEPYNKRHTLNLNDLNSMTEDNQGTLLFDLFELVKFIDGDDFWRVQIEQIYVKGNEVELVPRVGTHIIQFGTLDNFDKKFRNLRALYEQGLKKVGWNKYNAINLKYNNQVICTKR
jgi:cell division protein FtsQ